MILIIFILKILNFKHGNEIKFPWLTKYIKMFEHFITP